MKESIDEIQRATMLLDLKNLDCELNHGGWVANDLSAVDYLILPLGNTEELENGAKIQEITNHCAIPICSECAKTLHDQDKEWLLVYCMKCGENHWLIRSLTKKYCSDEMILWLTSCHLCSSPGEKVKVFIQDKEDF